MNGDNPAFLSRVGVWSSSLGFSLIAGTGIWFFESPILRWFLLLTGLLHVLVVAHSAPVPFRRLLLSQSLIVASTLVAAVCHLILEIGVVRGVPRAFLSVLRLPWTSAGVARLFLHLILLIVVALASIVLTRRVLGARGEATRFATALYSASAANLAFDYARQQPLLNISVDPPAKDVIFAFALAAFDFSVLLHLTALMGLVVSSYALRHASLEVPDS